MINFETVLASKPKYLIGLIQASGVALYITLFVSTVMHFGSSFEDDVPFVTPIIFLMTFVTSALICGSLILAYPIWQIVQDRVKDAALIVAWSIAWLLVILLSFIIMTAVLASSRF